MSHPTETNTKASHRRGGLRTGAGRPIGSGKFKEPTVAIRIPISKLEQINAPAQFPLYTCSVSAGFPVPGDDHVATKLDLNTHLIQHPAATFFVRVSGDSMTGAGIYPGDLLIVDRSLKPAHGKIVIVAVDGQLTVKRLEIRGESMRLIAENPAYRPIEIKEESLLQVWGVVLHAIHTVS